MAKKKKFESPPFGAAIREGGMVVVEIGPKHARYEVHKTLLTDSSAYFRAAFRGEWAEAEDRKVVLEDVKPGIFNVFLAWLYTGKFPMSIAEWMHAIESNEALDDAGEELSELSHMEAIVFGDRILAPSFRNLVSNSFVDLICFFKLPAYYETIIYAFSNLAHDDVILDLVVETYCRFWKEHMDGKQTTAKAQLPTEFLVQVMDNLMKRRASDDWEELDPCSYHLHLSEEEEEECKECRLTDYSNYCNL